MKKGINFELPEGSKIIHMGGWKKLESEKISKDEFNKACRLIGIFNESKKSLEKRKKASAQIDEMHILKQIEARVQARKFGDYKLADKIRDELLKNGIVIEDKQNKTTWKYK